jgi:serine/threonine protein kinase
MIGELLSADPAAVGPYRLVGRLGTGGMGQVFLGQSPGGRLVAVKVIRPELAGEPGFRRRFAREVTAARNVSGLFTALVVNADPDAAMPWLATAYVAGPSLAEAVEEHGVLPARSVTGLAAGLAEGLAAIHAAGGRLSPAPRRPPTLLHRSPILWRRPSARWCPPAVRRRPGRLPRRAPAGGAAGGSRPPRR